MPQPDFTRYRIKPLGDFVNVHGQVKLIYGCSFADSDEFFERVDYIRNALLIADNDKSFDELMVDPLFAQSVARCLAMHGLSLADVSLRHIQDLLLYEVVEGVVQPGLLVRINTPRSKGEIETEADKALHGDSVSYERALAILSTHTNSVEEAIRLTHMLSVTQLNELMAERVKLQQPPDKHAKTRELLSYLDTPTEQLIPIDADAI